ncbi:SpoIIE family protein phosphatase [uncultured Microscilla sp.]|uniref:SpoIIE family protein phosphatase n=1 Tax=uncultured Microscilla sp. TaxID=432653 RepID=UPI00260B38B0|nr:SpoIIE family protein phosphatase [uncultured Microscilla sp.]
MIFWWCGIFYTNAQPLSSAAFPIKNKGVPFITNFTTKDYNAHDQNWRITQNNHKVLYVGNTTGLLEFDGVRWRLIEMPNKSSIRGMCYSSDGKVYIGGKGFIGYVATNATGQTYVASLMNKLPKNTHGFQTVWSIREVPNEGIVFRAREQLIILKQGKCKVIAPPEGTRFGFTFKINQQLYVSIPKMDILKLENGQLKSSKRFEKLKNENVKYAVPMAQGQWLLLTRHKLYIHDSTNTRPFATHLNGFFARNKLYSIAKINDHYYALGTNRAGILIIDKAGKVIQHIHQGNGLHGNNVYYLYLDQNRNLWAALSNGIALLEIASPFSKLPGTNGAIYNTHVHHDKLFSATSQGIQYHHWSSYQNPLSDATKFYSMPNFIHQTWAFSRAQNQLLAAYNPGVVQIENLATGIKLKALETLPANIWTFTHIAHRPNYLLAGSISGLFLLEWKNNVWQLKHKIKGFPYNSRYLQEGKNGYYWASNDQQGVYRFRLDPNQTQAIQVVLYNKAKGLPSNTFNRVYKVNGRNLVASQDGIYVYHQAKDRFVREKKLNQLLGTQQAALYLRGDAQHNIWAVLQGKTDKYFDLVLLKKNSDGYKRKDRALRKMRGVFIEKIAPHLNSLSNKDVLLATREGLIHYDPTIALPPFSFSALLRKVSVLETKDSVIFSGTSANPARQATVLPYKHNSLRFDASSTFYADAHQNQYRYWLEGLDTQWSGWTSETYKEYTNLPAGNYVLHLQTRNVYKAVSPMVDYHFRVLPPWYRTAWAYISYVLLGLLIITGGVRWYTARLRRQKEHLAQLVAARTKELKVQNSYLEQSYKNVSLMTKMGQEITASLDLDKVLYTIYENVNRLMDATIFGIGIYQPETQQVNFELAIERGMRYKPYSRSMSEKNQFSVWCIENKQSILMGNVVEEQYQYIEEAFLADQYLQDGSQSTMPASAVYVPLMIQDRMVGVISAQSFTYQAYTDYHLNLLKNLSLYVAIAIENAQIYQQIDQKNEDITASIKYARRIQQAILPLTDRMLKSLPAHFVLYLPRDIVSGDFYWFEETEGLIFLVAADCTGHGVSGALMTMLGSSALTEIVMQKKIHQPHQILNALDKVMRRILKSKDTHVQDGMDMAVCVIDKGRSQLHFAGAKNSLLLIQDGKAQEIKGDMYEINGHRKVNQPTQYCNHTIAIDQPTSFYIYSDGFQDQFGGADSKKFMKKRFRELIYQLSAKPIEQQKQLLQKKLHEWMAGQSQVDDILVIGVEIQATTPEADTT